MAALKNGIDNSIIQRDKNEDKNWIQRLREREKKRISFKNRTRDYVLSEFLTEIDFADKLCIQPVLYSPEFDPIAK